MLRQAEQSDLQSIQSLLAHYDLPTADCAAHLRTFLVIEDEQKVIAVGGYEVSGDNGLIRSFAVHPDFKGQGLAELIFHALKEQAQKSNLAKFYLLTTTASSYFERLGFIRCERDQVPAEIKATDQFSSLCPASATTMVLPLVGDR